MNLTLVNPTIKEINDSLKDISVSGGGILTISGILTNSCREITPTETIKIPKNTKLKWI